MVFDFLFVAFAFVTFSLSGFYGSVSVIGYPREVLRVLESFGIPLDLLGTEALKIVTVRRSGAEEKGAGDDVIDFPCFFQS